MLSGIVREEGDEPVDEIWVMTTSAVYAPEARPEGFTEMANVAGLVPFTVAVAGLALM